MTMTRKDSEGVLLYDTYSSVKVPIDGKNIYNPEPIMEANPSLPVRCTPGSIPILT